MTRLRQQESGGAEPSLPQDAHKPETVVVVDKEPLMCDYLTEVLTLAGYRVNCFHNSLTALTRMTEGQPRADLVVTEVEMPGADGLHVLRSIRRLLPDLPVVLLSALYECKIALEALRNGAVDYLVKPVTPNQLLEVVQENVKPGMGRRRDTVRRMLGTLLDRKGAKAFEADDVHRVFEVVGLKRLETQHHCTRVAAYAVMLAHACGFPPERLGEIGVGALLHDIGKIVVPPNVLLKSGPLDRREKRIMQLHPEIGFELLSGFEEFEVAAQIAYSHHESFDASGYPLRLAEADIPLVARLFSIVDTFDAITSDRPYRSAQSIEAARAEIGRCSGAQFDPDLVRTFMRLPLDQLERIRSLHSGTEEASGETVTMKTE